MAFGYYKVYTINSAQVPSAQSNMPLLLPTAADNDLRTVANGGHGQSATGLDQRPYTSTALSSAMTFELVPGTYNASTGAREMWANHASAQTGAVVVLAYGDASLTTDGSSTSTWPSTYKAVLHMGDGTTISANDSTSNGNNFTNANATATTGKVGGAASFNGSSAKLTRSGLVIPTSGAIAVWWKPKVTPGTNNLPPFLTYDSTGVKLFGIQPFSDGKIYSGWYNSGNDDRVAWTETGISISTYYMLTISWTNGAVTYFLLDAVEKQTHLTLDATWDTSSKTSAIGWDESSNVFANIDADELRLRDTEVSQDWNTAEYNNQNAPASFWATGTEVSLAAAAHSSIMFILAGYGNV